MVSPRAELLDSVVSTTSDRSGVSASESEVSNDEELEEPVQLVAKKNTTSKVWKYLGFVPDKDGNPVDSATPKCKLCFKSVSAKWANISNLLTHLKNKHAAEYHEIKQSEDSSSSSMPRRKENSLERNQQTLTRYINKGRVFGMNSKENRRFTRAVTNFIVKDVVPVYKEGFRDMISAIEPQYQLSSQGLF